MLNNFIIILIYNTIKIQFFILNIKLNFFFGKNSNKKNIVIKKYSNKKIIKLIKIIKIIKKLN